MYFNGENVPQDYAEAAKWYRKAAERGHAKSQFGLALMYEKGWGVPKDDVQAHTWSNLAALTGKEPGAVKLRDILAENMTSTDISEAQRLAREWWAVFEARRKKK